METFSAVMATTGAVQPYSSSSEEMAKNLVAMETGDAVLHLSQSVPAWW